MTDFPEYIRKKDYRRLKNLLERRKELRGVEDKASTYASVIQAFTDLCDVYGLNPFEVAEALEDDASKREIEELDRWYYGQRR